MVVVVVVVVVVMVVVVALMTVVTTYKCGDWICLPLRLGGCCSKDGNDIKGRGNLLTT
jgi:hypothetical protein